MPQLLTGCPRRDSNAAPRARSFGRLLVVWGSSGNPGGDLGGRRGIQIGAVQRHTGATDAGCAEQLLQEVAVRGVARYDVLQIGLLSGRDVDERLVAAPGGEIQGSRWNGTDAVVAARAFGREDVRL